MLCVCVFGSLILVKPDSGDNGTKELSSDYALGYFVTAMFLNYESGRGIQPELLTRIPPNPDWILSLLE